ncbi:hypothetical protein WAI453_007576 [Rhynchosporium graminicola]
MQRYFPSLDDHISKPGSLTMAEHFSPLEKSLTLLKWLGQHHSFAKPGPLIAVLQCRTSFQAHYMARDAHLVPPEYVNHYRKYLKMLHAKRTGNFSFYNTSSPCL